MRSDSFRRQRVELAICAGTSLINVILGFFFCLAVIVDDILRFKHKMNWKFAVLLTLKLCILSLYPRHSFNSHMSPEHVSNFHPVWYGTQTN